MISFDTSRADQIRPAWRLPCSSDPTIGTPTGSAPGHTPPGPRQGERHHGDEGRELPDIEAARKEAIAAARDVIAEDVREGHLDLMLFIAVENEAHELLFRVGFADALTMRIDGARYVS
ncbi:hypothetical protein ACFB49_26870 [Sphingomonas sp. DBB INV C78]